MSRGWIVFLAALFTAYLCTDRLFFDWALWRFPNETGWETEPHYNFEYALRRVPPKIDGRRRIIVIGSSIAGYSVLPDQLREDLCRNAPRSLCDVEIAVLSHQGMNGMNLLTYADRIAALLPDLVVLPTNMVDYRVERPIMLGLMDELKQPEGSLRRARAVRALSRDLLLSPEVRTIGAAGALRHTPEFFTLPETASLWAAVLSPALRYRDTAAVPWAAYYAHRFGRDRSYTHAFGSGNRITLSGWTAPEFSVRVTPRLIARGLEIQSPDKSGDGPRMLFLAGSDSEGCAAAMPEAVGFPLKQGWQKIDIKKFSHSAFLCAQVKPPAYSSEMGVPLGVRLTATAGLEPDQLARRRELRYDDILYAGYSDAQYKLSFERRILRFDRAGMEYLQALEIAKRVWSGKTFDAGLPALTAVAHWKSVMERAGIPVLTVESPENPLSRRWYGYSAWAASFSAFLGENEAAHGSGRCPAYAKAVDLLPMQNFYDYHHLSYFGAQKFTAWLSVQITASLQCREPKR